MRRISGCHVGPALFLLAFAPLATSAQQGQPQRAAHLAYDSEMAQAVIGCPDAITLTDRNECLVNTQDRTYKNFDAFFLGLREALIEEAPNDANALALDAAERAWEKYRTTTCDAVGATYDTGTIAHPGMSGSSAKVRCLIQVTRSRMRDLMQLYDATL